MYKCNVCNKIFDEPISESAESFYGVSGVFSYSCGERVYMCPYCEGTFKKVKKCDYCEEYFHENELIEIIDRSGEHYYTCKECVYELFD